MRWNLCQVTLSAMCAMALVVHGHLAEAQVIKAGSPSCPAVALTYDLCPVRTAPGFDRELIDFLIMNKIPTPQTKDGRSTTCFSSPTGHNDQRRKRRTPRACGLSCGVSSRQTRSDSSRRTRFLARLLVNT